jgi:hypothetical protein
MAALQLSKEFVRTAHFQLSLLQIISLSVPAVFQFGKNLISFGSSWCNGLDSQA